MNRKRLPAAFLLLLSSFATSTAALAQTGETYQPKVGQAGKDVVWVPTPAEMVEKMLDLAAITPNDVVIDLGSGDGRNVIAAAKRGARARGVEFNPDLVEFSRRAATREGVASRATFVQGDMYEAEFSDATVLVLFLLPDNLRKLQSKILQLKPGTRVVANTFGFSEWPTEATAAIENGCRAWCQAMLYLVPARVDGSWQLPQGTLELYQEFQTIKGTLTADGRTLEVQNGLVKVNDVTFTIGEATYSGRIRGDAIEGTVENPSGRQPFVARRNRARSRSVR
jgi:precorrin-6B methylase 2